MSTVTPTPGPLPLPIPRGWYCLGFADEHPAGGVRAARLAGHELVVVRPAAGGVAVLDAYCPHLGAHLAVGGRLEGETLTCPFHGFRFDLRGACVSTPYGGKVPPTAKLRCWPAVERHGLLLCWYAPDGGEPTFDVPEWPTDGWTAWRHHRFELRSHPQEIAENSVDLGHFGVVHGYREVTPLSPLEVDGPVLRARYSFVRPGGVAGSGPVRTEIDIHQWGLGHALVEAAAEPIGVRTRHLVLALPVEADRLHLRIGMSVQRVEKPGAVHPLARWLPGGWLAERIADIGIRQYVDDVSQDVPVWEHKAFLPRPALADGDGPIGAYRRWAAQFLPQPQARG